MPNPIPNEDISQETWSKVIRPRTGWRDVHLAELWTYRDLIFLFVRRNFVALYKQTILGPAWAILQPLLTTLMFTVVFSGIARLSTDGVPGFLFYMCGNVCWNYFSKCLEKTSQTFLDNEKLFGKVYFPRLTVPISTMILNFVNFAIQFTFFSGFLAYYALQPDPVVHVNWSLALFTPLMLIQMGLLGMGVGIIITALTVRYRDLSLLTSFGISLWMYATPVAYPVSMIETNYPALMNVYMLNPMAPIVEFFRAAFLGVGTVRTSYLIVGAVVTLVLLTLGILLYSRMEKTFMDTV